jgi:hypothetical protein
MLRKRLRYGFWLVVDKAAHLTFRIPRPYRIYTVQWDGDDYEFVLLDWKWSWGGMAWTNCPCNKVELAWGEVHPDG